MDAFLLTTKLRIPPQPNYVVHRARLIDALEGGVSQHKLVHLSAPAGYGKTTLLAQWSHSSRYLVAWLSLSAEDNDLERFLRYLFLAWEGVQPGVRESNLGHLLGAMMPDSEAALSAFINLANDVVDNLVIVIDDYHLIEEPSIHSSLTFLLDHLPPTLHFVLAGRAEPPLPLARYRARHELMELRSKDLQFLQEETADFLHHRMGIDLSNDEVIRLQSQLEGWIAGLQLTALTLQNRLGGADKLVISGRHRFIADYLSEDVLAPLTVGKRHFLLQTSILDRLSGPLCDAVAGMEGGQEMLESLERENLFIVPLDDSREWFRYHPLFADFLQAELQRRHHDEVPELHHRAALWYLDHDMPEQAMPHAVEGSDAGLAVHIFDRYGNIKILAGDFATVRRWLEEIPAEWSADYPVLGLAQAALLFFSGQFDAAIRRVDEVELSLTPADSEDTRWGLARVTATRCMIACVQNDVPQAESLAYKALRELKEEDFGWRPGIYSALGDTYRQNGRWEEAKTCYLKMLDFTRAPAIRFASAHGLCALADLALRQGHLREAAEYWKKALVVIRDQSSWGRLPLPLIGWVYIRLGELLYESNELAEARDHLSQGLERSELGGDVQALIAGYLLEGRLKLTEGEIEMAAEYRERARTLVENAQFSDWISRFERFQLEFWLTQGRPRAAIEWADAMLQTDSLELRPESEVLQLAIAHVLIVKGDALSIERALALLRRLLQAAEVEGRIGITIEALALQALADWQRGDRASGLITLERALRMAEPEGYVRLFADFGLPMVRLLKEVRSRGMMPEYVEKLLVACGTNLALPAKVILLEPLTPREMEILHLIAAGLTNLEIAQKLVISPETVKKHTGAIYGKLGVSNRTEAAARARELDLLD